MPSGTLTNKNIDEFEELSNYIQNGYRILTLVNCLRKFDKD